MRVHIRVCMHVHVCTGVLLHVCVRACVSFSRSTVSWWQIANYPFQPLLDNHFNHIKILTELFLGLSPTFLGETILLVSFSRILTSDVITHGDRGGPCSSKLLPGAALWMRFTAPKLGTPR